MFKFIPKVELFISVLEHVKDPAGPTFRGALVQLNVEPEGMIPATIYGSGLWGRNANPLLAETDGF